MRLRFTIRDLLWLTLVVALVLGWWVDHRINTIQGQSILKPHYVRNGSASSIAKLLNAVFAGPHQIRLYVDDRLNVIFAECPLQQQDGIEELIKKLDWSESGN